MLKPPFFAPTAVVVAVLAFGCGRAALEKRAPSSRGSPIGQSPPATAHPQAQLTNAGLLFATADVDVGVSNGTVTQEYRYANVGDCALDILTATPSCSCTVP
ncbi:MAG TPA: hypothetical protein VND64_19225 [Pirellulales bacterium]|nr:hypothetical protein [Pirellulales bacterium]